MRCLLGLDVERRFGIGGNLRQLRSQRGRHYHNMAGAGVWAKQSL